MSDLTPEELKWVRALQRLGKKIPSTLGLWGGLGGIRVIVLDENGSMQHTGLGRHEEAIVFTGHVMDVPAGGGDPDNMTIDEIDRPWVEDS